jgi:hypothetical protein
MAFHDDYMNYLNEISGYFLSYFTTHNFVESISKVDESTLYKKYKQLGKTNEEFLNNTLQEVIPDLNNLDGGTRKTRKQPKKPKQNTRRYKRYLRRSRKATPRK